MCLPVMGTAKGYTVEEAKEPAIALGIALQITNILRDVGEDAVRGRIYLPLEDLERFGVTEQNLINGTTIATTTTTTNTTTTTTITTTFPLPPPPHPATPIPTTHPYNPYTLRHLSFIGLPPSTPAS